jgi:hypothetical protein
MVRTSFWSLRFRFDETFSSRDETFSSRLRACGAKEV